MHLKEIYDRISETVERLSREKPQGPVPKGWKRSLSLREIEILTLVADGLTNKEIGDMLGISDLTVKTHLARISDVMGVGRRELMVLCAFRAGVIE